jgi:hypothetical protein
MRFLIVLRPITNDPHLRDRVQKWVKPKKSNVSGFPLQGSHAAQPHGGQNGSAGSCPGAMPIRTRAVFRVSLCEELEGKFGGISTTVDEGSGLSSVAKRDLAVIS